MNAFSVYQSLDDDLTGFCLVFSYYHDVAAAAAAETTTTTTTTTFYSAVSHRQGWAYRA